MKLIVIGLAFILILFPQWAGAQEEHKQHEMNTKKMAMGGENAGQEKTLTGRLIGLTCYLKHNLSGPDHKKCARMCAEKGLPLALRTNDGVLYQIFAKGHDDLKTANVKLLDYIEGSIVVTGKVFEKNGIKAIVIDKITKK